MLGFLHCNQMYRKRASILTVKSISQSISQVSSSPNSSSPSQNTLLNSIKISPLSHLRRRRSFSVAAQRSDFWPDSDRNGSYHQNPSGSDSSNSLDSQQDRNGYQRNNLGEVRQGNSNGFCGEGAAESYQRGPFGPDRVSSASSQQNLNGFNRGSSEGYQRSNLGEARQWNSDGFYRENQNGHMNQTTNFPIRFQREGSRVGGQSNQMNNDQNMRTDGFYRERTGDVGRINQNSKKNHTGNSLGACQQNPRVLSDGSGVDDGYPYDNQNGFFRENHREVHRDPTEHYTVNPGKLYQRGPIVGGQFNQMNNGQNMGNNSLDRERTGGVGRINQNSNANHTGNSLENFQQNPRVLSDGSGVGDGYPYENQSGFFRENHREVHRDPIKHYDVNRGKLYQNFYGHQRGNSMPSGHQNLRESPLVSSMKSNYEFSTHELTEIGEIGTFQNHDGLCGGNHGEVHQNPSGHYSVNPGQLYRNSYGSHRENPLPYIQQNLSESPPNPISSVKFNDELSTGGSHYTAEMITYEGTLNKLEEFCKEGKVKEAVAVLAVFEKVGMVIDCPIYLRLVQACGDAKSLDKARLVHDHLSQTLGEVEVWFHNKILDMYAKCGSMDDAYQLFEKMPQRNLTSWETMIRGLSNNGLGEEAIDMFTQFKKMGVKPDGGIFTAVFYTCGVLGAVDQGMLYFESMKVDFGIAPIMEHYVSIVDMLGRSGHLDEAFEFIEMMPIEPNIAVWETLLKFCRVNGYIELGDRCAEIMGQLDTSRLKQSKMGLLPVKTSEITKGIESKSNSDSLNVKRQVHEFMAGDRSHPENAIIYKHIRCLAQQMKEAGYIPDIICALHDVDQESREEALLYHSERLATVHGLMSSAARVPIRVIKNLRVCRDCHNAMKIISKLVGRVIIARDIKRFHHFENGVCSCNDYW